MIQPLLDKVLVKPNESGENKSAGGLLLVNDDNPFERGEVVAKGTGWDEESTNALASIDIGDVVLYGRHKGIEFKEEGVDYVLVPVTSLLAKE